MGVSLQNYRATIEVKRVKVYRIFDSVRIQGVAFFIEAGPGAGIAIEYLCNKDLPHLGILTSYYGDFQQALDDGWRSSDGN